MRKTSPIVSPEASSFFSCDKSVKSSQSVLKKLTDTLKDRLKRRNIEFEEKGRPFSVSPDLLEESKEESINTETTFVDDPRKKLRERADRYR